MQRARELPLKINIQAAHFHEVFERPSYILLLLITCVFPYEIIKGTV